MPTTARGLWYPDTSSPANPISIGTTAATSQQAALDALALGEGVPRFTSAAARDAAYLAAGITVVTGMMCSILGVPYFFGPTHSNATAHWWPMNNLGLIVDAQSAAGNFDTTGGAILVIPGSSFTSPTSFTLTEPRYLSFFARFNTTNTVANTIERMQIGWIRSDDIRWQDNVDSTGSFGYKINNAQGLPQLAAAGTYNMTINFWQPYSTTGVSTVNSIFIKVTDLGAA